MWTRRWNFVLGGIVGKVIHLCVNFAPHLLSDLRVNLSIIIPIEKMSRKIYSTYVFCFVIRNKRILNNIIKLNLLRKYCLKSIKHFEA